MKKIIVIGTAMQDIFINYEGAESMHLHNNISKKKYLIFKEGIKIDIKNIIYASGGGATNVSAGLSKLGIDTTALFRISNDNAGTFIYNDIQKYHIKLENIKINESGNSGISFILPTLENNYTALCYRGINDDLKVSQEEYNLFKKFNYLYLAGLSGQAAKNILDITKKAKENNILVITNPGATQITKNFEITCQALKFVDILIFNSYEAETFFKIYLNLNKISSKSIFEKEKLDIILNMGPKIIVITDGSKGVYLATKEFIIFHPSIKTDKIVNTLGAGDAFSSGFIGSLIQDKSLEESLIMGILNSTSVLEYLDAKSGLLNHHDIKSKFKTVGLTNLKKHYW